MKNYSIKTIKISYKGRSVGLKISRLENGDGVITAQEVNGKKLFVAS